MTTNLIQKLIDQRDQMKDSVEKGFVDSLQHLVNELTDTINASGNKHKELIDQLESAWNIIANVDSGNWTQPLEWIDAVVAWRENYFILLEQ
jgi:hypothetical protein